MNRRTLTATAISVAAFVALVVPAAVLAKPGAATDSVSLSDRVVVVAQDSGADKPSVKGWQTGAGEASDETCQSYGDSVQEAIDDAETDFASGDMDGGFKHLEMAEVVEDAALNRGCAISYPV